MAEYNTKTDYIIEYNYIFVNTYENNCIHEFDPQDLPDFVQMYLTLFYDNGWLSENEELRAKVLDYFSEQVNGEIIESIVGKTDWGEDIIYGG